MFKSQDQVISLASLTLRVGVGFFMISHGVEKIMLIVAGKLDYFPVVLGVPKAAGLWISFLTQGVCALIVAFGFRTRYFAIPVFLVMGAAGIVVHQNDALFMINAGGSVATAEPALLYVVSYFAIFILGSGKYSLDYVLSSIRMK